MKYRVLAHGNESAFRRAPHGARGLKSGKDGAKGDPGGRAPHGARGLKYQRLLSLRGRKLVAPHTGRVD